MNDHGKYIEKFHDPEFTYYDFLTLFCAINAENQKFYFDRDILVQFIDQCKNNNDFEDILNEINLNSNGVHKYSEGLENAISLLRWARIVYTISPEVNSTVHIFKNIPINDLIKSREKFLESMQNFVMQYTKIENKRNNSILKLSNSNSI